MRIPAAAIACLLIFLGPATAEDEKKPDPNPPAKDMTDAEREEAVKTAAALTPRVLKLWQSGKYTEAEPLARKALALRESALGPRHTDVAASASDLGVVLRSQRKFREARKYLERALEIREKTLGPDHPHVAHSVRFLAELWEDQGAYKKARVLHERALAITEKALGPDHPELASRLNSLAAVLERLQAFNQARASYERALEIREKAVGPEHRSVATLLNNLATLLKNLGTYDEAGPLQERALKIREKAYGPEHPRVAVCLNGLALIRQAQGAYGEARRLAERALKIREKAYGPDHQRVASSLSNLALILEDQGVYDEARPLLERALRVRERVYGPEHPQVATSLSGLAAVLMSAGDYPAARPLFERALAIREKALGANHLHVAASLNNLGVLLSTIGDYEEARSLHERALRIRENALGRDHPRVASTLTHLARLLDSLGAHEQARPLHERAVEIKEKALGPEHPDFAIAISSLAELLTSIGDYAEAQALFERTLKIAEKSFEPGHPRVAAALDNLAAVLHLQGETDAARRLQERALKITEDAFGPDHLRVAVSLNNVASLLKVQGAYEEARPLFERSLKIREDMFGSANAYVARALMNLGRLEISLKQYERAAPHVARCLDIMEQYIRGNLTGVQASGRLALLRSLRGYLGTSLRVSDHLGLAGQDELLRFKGLLTRAATAERRLARMGGKDTAARVEALRAAERSLAKIANSPRTPRDKDKERQWQEAYAEAAAEREELALALARDFEPMRQALERLNLRTPDVQAALAPGAVLIDYLRAGDQYMAWVVPHKGEVKRVNLGDADTIESAAAAFAEHVANDDEPAWGKTGKALRDLILSPLHAHIGTSTATLHICPDAALAAVPFSALPSAEGRALFGSKFTISNVSMAQDLVPWRQSSKPGKGMLLLGGVDYGKAAEPTASEPPRVLAARAPSGGTYTYLSGTKEEIQAIAKGSAADATTILGPQATEAAFRRDSRGKRVVHLATHGFVRDDLMRGLYRTDESKEWLGAAMERQLAAGHDPLNLSGVALAGANTRKGGGDDDGILTALEASHLDLDATELVVLSACQTALGTAEAGEGVIGLVRGFQMAGAKQVIGSLWKVDDDATRALMVKFYGLWSPKEGQGLGAAAALKKAQAFLRGHEEWKHPYYWAAWVVWGVD